MLTSRECGKRCRVAFSECFKSQWGAYRFRDRQIIFKDSVLLSLYSDYNVKGSKWFYGVPKIEWEDWRGKHLLFLMKEANYVSYVMLNPNESEALLSKCSQDKTSGEKKISIRRRTNGGNIYFVEWNELHLLGRVHPLEVSWV